MRPYCMRGIHLEDYCMKKQVDQLTTLLKQNKISLPQREKMSDDGHEKCHYLKYGLPRSTTYLIDSGESSHMISSNDFFSTLNLTEGPTIYIGDDSQILAAGRGTIKIQHGELINVLYVPSLAANMLSIYRMTHTVSLKQVVFLPDSMKITNISTGEIIVKGTIDHSSKGYTFSHFMPYQFQHNHKFYSKQIKVYKFL